MFPMQLSPGLSRSKMLENANADGPTVGAVWSEASDASRLNRVNGGLRENSDFEALEAVDARLDGQVFLSLLRPLRASERGILLRDAEAHLKVRVDAGIVVWCQPIGDKNSLRRLRGVELKT